MLPTLNWAPFRGLASLFLCWVDSKATLGVAIEFLQQPPTTFVRRRRPARSPLDDQFLAGLANGEQWLR